MSIASKLEKLQTDLANAYNSIETKGGTIPQNKNTENLSTAIEGISGGGDGSSLNIFVQDTEPEVKKGIWLQTNKTPEHYIYDEEVFIGGEWLDNGVKAEIPGYTYQSPQAVTIGTDVYLFGIGNTSAMYNLAYKYDTLTDTYTQLRNIPFIFVTGCAVSIGTDIYLIGSSDSSSTYKFMYKYDTLTDTYARLTDNPYSFYGGAAVAVGTDIYIIGGLQTPSVIQKYDTLTDTYTRLTDIPYPFKRGSATVVGNKIHLIGSDQSGYYRNHYTYDITSGIYSQMSNYPYSGNAAGNCAVVVGSDIYIFGNMSSEEKKAYKYSTLTNTYTQLTNVPYTCYSGGIAFVGNQIYLFKNKRVQVYALESKTYQQDELVVICQGKYKTVGYEIDLYDNDKDVNSAKYAFADAWYYTTQDGLITNIPTYYGDGTNWIKLKN